MSEIPTDAIETMMEPVAPWWTTLKGLPSMMKALAQARQDVLVSQACVDEADTMLKSTHPYARLQAAKQSLAKDQARMESITALAKEEALKNFRFNSSKQVYAGVQIKLFARVDYDPEAMRDWARENMMSLLTLDTKATDIAAKAGLLDDAPVTVYKDPRAIIASDLSGYLAEVKP